MKKTLYIHHWFSNFQTRRCQVPIWYGYICPIVDPESFGFRQSQLEVLDPPRKGLPKKTCHRSPPSGCPLYKYVLQSMGSISLYPATKRLKTRTHPRQRSSFRRLPSYVSSLIYQMMEVSFRPHSTHRTQRDLSPRDHLASDAAMHWCGRAGSSPAPGRLLAWCWGKSKGNHDVLTLKSFIGTFNGLSETVVVIISCFPKITCPGDFKSNSGIMVIDGHWWSVGIGKRLFNPEIQIASSKVSRQEDVKHLTSTPSWSGGKNLLIPLGGCRSPKRVLGLPNDFPPGSTPPEKFSSPQDRQDLPPRPSSPAPASMAVVQQPHGATSWKREKSGGGS